MRDARLKEGLILDAARELIRAFCAFRRPTHWLIARKARAVR
jgi:hypothetical protein